MDVSPEEQRIKYLEKAIMEHDKPLPNWPNGKSTVDRNIRRYYMVEELARLKAFVEGKGDE